MAHSTPNTTPPRKFSAINRLLGNTAYQTLAQSSVLIVGIGGVGSWTTEALARSGLGKITVADLGLSVECTPRHAAKAQVARRCDILQGYPQSRLC